MNTYFKNLFTLSKIRLLIIYTLIFMLSGLVGNIWMTRNQHSGLAPSIMTKDLNGRDIQPGYDSLQSKSKLVYFFADWCPICKVQHSVITALDKDYDVIGIAMQSGDDANVKEYVLSQELDFAVVNDESGDISRSFGVNGVPATFIIDKTGQVKYSTRGYATEAGLLGRIWLADKH